MNKNMNIFFIFDHCPITATISWLRRIGTAKGRRNVTRSLTGAARVHIKGSTRHVDLSGVHGQWKTHSERGRPKTAYAETGG